MAPAAAPAAEAWEMTPAERAAFRAEVRALLLDEPGIVARALAPSAGAYADAAAEDAAMLERLAAPLYRDDADFAAGPPGGVPLVAFLPAACGHCDRLLAELRTLARAAPETRLVVKDVPVASRGGETAARYLTAVLRVLGPDAWREARTALSALPEPGNPEALRLFSQVMGWPADRLAGAMHTAYATGRIDRTRALVAELGFDTFPSYVVDGTMIRGDVPPALLARYLPVE